MILRFLIALLFPLVLIACSGEKLSMVSGGQKALSDWEGDWLLINYWAIWCKPCIKEIPELNKLNQQPDITMLGYNFDGLQAEELSTQANQLGIDFELISEDPAALFGQARPSALPATIVLSKDGQFQRWLMGPQTEQSIMLALQQIEGAK